MLCTAVANEKLAANLESGKYGDDIDSSIVDGVLDVALPPVAPIKTKKRRYCVKEDFVKKTADDDEEEEEDDEPVRFKSQRKKE